MREFGEMKRFISVLAIIIFFALPMTLHADIVMGNDYFNITDGADVDKIIDSYDGIGKRFIINSPKGYVIPKENAGSNKGIFSPYINNSPYDVVVIPNGAYVNIKAVVLYKGKYWGVNPPGHDRYPRFWFLMDDLLMIYQREDFEKENEENIHVYTGDSDAVLSAEKLVVWQWPGSDREKKIIEDKETIGKCDGILFAYKDNEGREWGKSNYAQGWICLSDPENNSNITMFYPAPEPVKWSHDGSSDWTEATKVWPPAEPVSPLLIIIIASVVLVIIIAAVVTIALVFRAKRKKAKKNG